MGLLKSVLCAAVCMGALAGAARADQVTGQDVGNPGKPVIVPLVNLEETDGVEQIYIQDI